MSTLTDQAIQRDFPTYVHISHKILRNKEVLDDDPYLGPVLTFAEDIANGTIRRGIVNLPPGTAKSFIFSACLPSWILARNPSASVMVVGHNKKNVRDSTRRIRQIMQSDFYLRNFETRIDSNWKGAGDFGTTQGGSVYATTIRGGITGYRADLIVVDDPVAIKDADNIVLHEFVNRTFDAEISSRVRNKRSRIVVIMHRLSEYDLTAHLLGNIT